MKLFTTTFILSFFFVTANGQNKINGTWYTYLRNKGLMMQLSDNSMATKIVWLGYYDDSERVFEGRHIVKTFNLNGCEYDCFADTAKRFPCPPLGCPTPDTVRPKVKYGIGVFRVLEEGKSILLVVNEKDSSFMNLNEVRRYIQKDTAAKFGITFYTKEGIEQLKQLPPVDSMPVEKFIDVLSAINDEGHLLKKTYEGYDLLYYFYFKMRDRIREKGFDPLYTEEAFTAYYNKYKDNPEVIELLQKIEQ